ncbi:hypothetical protein HanRHA438_Chr02g0090271 [Helianthus annuus]|nr:hypothetical protein HanRHA438_Chr02g0090271 [Helianthus annuus]
MIKQGEGLSYAKNQPSPSLKNCLFNEPRLSRFVNFQQIRLRCWWLRFHKGLSRFVKFQPLNGFIQKFTVHVRVRTSLY